jgi:hypothetical protein
VARPRHVSMYGKEIGSGQHRHMRGYEVFPGGLAAAFWGWRNAMSLQDITNRLIGDVVAQVRRGAGLCRASQRRRLRQGTCGQAACRFLPG